MTESIRRCMACGIARVTSTAARPLLEAMTGPPVRSTALRAASPGVKATLTIGGAFEVYVIWPMIAATG